MDIHEEAIELSLDRGDSKPLSRQVPTIADAVQSSAHGVFVCETVDQNVDLMDK